MPLISIIILLFLSTSSFAGTLTSIVGPAKVSDYDYYYKAVSSSTNRPNDPLLSSTYSSNTGTKVSDTRFTLFDGQNYYCDMTVSTSTQKQSYSASYIDFYTIYNPCPGQKDNYFCYTSYNEYTQNPASGLPVPTSVYCTYSNYPEFYYFNLHVGDDVLRITDDGGGPSSINCSQYPYNCLEYLTTTTTNDSRISYNSFISLTDLTPRQSVKLDFDNVVIKSSKQPAYVPNFIGFKFEYVNDNDAPVTEYVSPKSIVMSRFQTNDYYLTSTWTGRFYIEHTFQTNGKNLKITPYMSGAASSMYYAKMPIESITVTVLQPHVVWRYVWDFEALNAIKKLFSDRFTAFFDLVKNHFKIDFSNLDLDGDPEIVFNPSHYLRPLDHLSDAPDVSSSDGYSFDLSNDTFLQIYPALSVLVHLIACYGATRIVLKVKS